MLLSHLKVQSPLKLFFFSHFHRVLQFSSAYLLLLLEALQGIIDNKVKELVEDSITTMAIKRLQVTRATKRLQATMATKRFQDIKIQASKGCLLGSI